MAEVPANPHGTNEGARLCYQCADVDETSLMIGEDIRILYPRGFGRGNGPCLDVAGVGADLEPGQFLDLGTARAGCR